MHKGYNIILIMQKIELELTEEQLIKVRKVIPELADQLPTDSSKVEKANELRAAWASQARQANVYASQIAELEMEQHPDFLIGMQNFTDFVISHHTRDRSTFGFGIDKSSLMETLTMSLVNLKFSEDLPQGVGLNRGSKKQDPFIFIYDHRGKVFPPEYNLIVESFGLTGQTSPEGSELVQAQNFPNKNTENLLRLAVRSFRSTSRINSKIGTYFSQPI